MSKLWLTYAWADNEQSDVDFILKEMKGAGLEVRFDRAQLLVGQPLWRQIDREIADPNLQAWAIYVTEASLRSEPCQEELAYALDRALRTRGSNFPLIGIFPSPIDRSFIPSALATRLYVDLRSPDWLERIVDGVNRRPNEETFDDVQNEVFIWHPRGSGWCLEARPRAGRWVNPLIGVENAELDLFQGVFVGPRDHPSPPFMGVRRPFTCEGFAGFATEGLVSPETSAYAIFTQKPRSLLVGPMDAFKTYKVLD